MCGITGILSQQGSRVDPALLLRMTNSIRHRGPDDEGYLLVDMASDRCEERVGDDSIAVAKEGHQHITTPFQENYNLGLGWRRLSIIDLSPSGHEPMSNGDGTVWLIFNGEIYNYIELREQLIAKGYVFRTKTDGEVIIHAYEEWGKDCLNRFNGMWAFALWDSRTKTLFCARDRFGVKPFYYFKNESGFVFASEIKALLLHPGIAHKANRQIIFDYLAYAVIDHSDETFFSGIKQLPPSHYLVIDAAGRLTIQRYYILQCNSAFERYNEENNKRHVEKFRELLFDSIKLRLRTDVPLGSCLSGGLDSSTIVCIANSLMFNDGVIDRTLIGEHQKTFTAVYDDATVNEKPFVEKVIARTSAESHFVRPDGNMLWDELRKVVYHQDEPFNSTSVYAQWNVMRLAAEHHITVLLDGQGGDELLGGYAWHVPIYQAELLRTMRLATLMKELAGTSSITRRRVHLQLVDLLGKTGRNFLPQSAYEFFAPGFDSMNHEFSDSHKRASTVLTKRNDSLQERLLQEETGFNLQQLLHYEDRNSMAFSIEARVPFVDYRVVEYAMSIPASYKIHNGWSKYPLRGAAEGILPKEIQWRKDKMGFVTPQEKWMRLLQPMIRTFLLDGPLRSKQFLNEEYIQRFLSEQSKIASDTLWRIVNLEMWMRVFNVE
ncbi:MAG: asparagine synthase (glutamine-hydrolyzing) [Bacteroidota bacterium]